MIRCYIFLSCFLSYLKISNSELVLVHALFRHGHRTPGSTYNTDPYKDKTYFPLGNGQLTNTGKLHEYNLGSILRQRYDDFLGDLYMPEILDARSTDSDRTKMSLELVLASLFPPEGTELQWHPTLNWQPIPYKYENLDQDKLFYAMASCGNYDEHYQNYMESDEGLSLLEEYDDLLGYLAEHTDQEKQFMNFLNLYPELKAQDEWGLTLPEWTQKVYPDQVEDVTATTYTIMSATTEMKQVTAGFLLQKIVEDTQSKIDGDPDLENRKLFLYSGHEFNVAALLVTLGVFEKHMPPYGSCLLFEIHHNDDEYGIELYYEYYEADGSPVLLKLPDCDEFCSWDQFVSIVEEYFPSEDSCGEDPVDHIKSLILNL